MINSAVDVIDGTVRQMRQALRNSTRDGRCLSRAQHLITVRLEVPAIGIDDRNLIHLDHPIAIFGVQPKDHSAVLANAKIKLWQVVHASPVQKVMMRWQASVSASSDVA